MKKKTIKRRRKKTEEEKKKEVGWLNRGCESGVKRLAWDGGGGGGGGEWAHG